MDKKEKSIFTKENIVMVLAIVAVHILVIALLVGIFFLGNFIGDILINRLPMPMGHCMAIIMPVFAITIDILIAIKFILLVWVPMEID